MAKDNGKIYIKAIPGFPKAYATKDGKILVSKDGVRFYERVFQTNHNGYLTVKLTDKLGETHQRKVHRLVALAFIPNPFNFELVLHLDNNPKNNRVDNLKWGTQKENMQQMVRDGRQRKSELIKFLPRVAMLVDQGYKASEISQILNISRTSTGRLIKKLQIKNHQI